MNFQCDPVYTPLRVLVVNPLCSAAQLIITKIMSGLVFGREQLVDLTLLVYANEKAAAGDLCLELHSCGFCCMSTITISTDLPLISDADVFCFITNFRNPNSVDLHAIDNQEFDVLYLIIRIANSLCKQQSVVKKEDDEKDIRNKRYEEEKKPHKPIIMTDGVVAMNILKYLAKSLPSEIFFCPTPLPALGKKLLADQLKVPPNRINNMMVWGANDSVFHIAVAKPILKGEAVFTETDCDWDMVEKDVIRAAGLDNTLFNETWLKKDLVAKVHALASKNPYGNIYRAADFARTLNIVWKTRAPNAEEGLKVYASAGVISDGSLDTVKGFAYILPLVFSGDSWTVDPLYGLRFHVKQEIKRINKTIIELRDNLIPFCKRFLEENVKHQAFIPVPDPSESDVTQYYSPADNTFTGKEFIVNLRRDD